MSVGYLYVFREMSIPVFCPFLSQVFLFFYFCYGIVEVFNIFWILASYHLYGLQIFQFHMLPFHSISL